MRSKKARKASGLAGLVLTSVALAACGSTSTTRTITDTAAVSPPAQSTTVASTTNAAATSSGPVQVTISSPAQGGTVNAAQVDVRGTVSPSNAAVEVDGQNAQVGNGVFSASVPLNTGSNSIDVIASAPGSSPGSTSVQVTRSSPAKPKPKPAPQPTHTTTVVDTATVAAPAAAPAPDPDAGDPAPGDNVSCGGTLYVNSVTSCPFADNVEDDYTGPGTDYAESPVTGDEYAMDCNVYTGTAVCTGGNGASVEFVP